MAWFQRLLKKRGRDTLLLLPGSDDEPAARQLSPEQHMRACQGCSAECCLEAPPGGAPPCVFCSFCRPTYFAGILNAALKVSECSSRCGVNGQAGCWVCSGQNCHRNCYSQRDGTVTGVVTTMDSLPHTATISKMSSDSYGFGKSNPEVAPRLMNGHRGQIQSYYCGPVMISSPAALWEGCYPTAMATPTTTTLNQPRIISSEVPYFQQPSTTSTVTVDPSGAISDDDTTVLDSAVSSDSNSRRRAVVIRNTIVTAARQASVEVSQPLSQKNLATSMTTATPVTTRRAGACCRVSSSQPRLDLREAGHLQGGLTQIGRFSSSSPPPPPAAISMPHCPKPLRLRGNSWYRRDKTASSQHSLGSRPQSDSRMRQATVTTSQRASIISGNDKVVETMSRRENSSTDVTASSSRRSSHNVSQRRLSYTPELSSLSIRATEMNSGSLSTSTAAVDKYGGRLRYRCWQPRRRDQPRRAFESFLLSGEPRRRFPSRLWCDKDFPTTAKPRNNLSYYRRNLPDCDSEDFSASAKRRRVGDSTFVDEPPPLIVPGPSSSNVTPALPRSLVKNPGSLEHKLLPAAINAETASSRITQKR